MADCLGSLLDQSDGDPDSLPEEDEEADEDKEEDPDDRGEGDPGVLLLQEVLSYVWCPVQLRAGL